MTNCTHHSHYIEHARRHCLNCDADLGSPSLREHIIGWLTAPRRRRMRINLAASIRRHA